MVSLEHPERLPSQIFDETLTELVQARKEIMQLEAEIEELKDQGSEEEES